MDTGSIRIPASAADLRHSPARANELNTIAKDLAATWTTEGLAVGVANGLEKPHERHAMLLRAMTLLVAYEIDALNCGPAQADVTLGLFTDSVRAELMKSLIIRRTGRGL